MKQKLEFSKLIIYITGSIFIISLLYCMIFYTVAMVTMQLIEWTPVVSVLPVTGGMFTTAIGFYYTKAQRENNIKLRKDVIKYKYELMNELGVLQRDECIHDLNNDFCAMEDHIVLAEQQDEMNTQNNTQGGCLL